MYVVTGASSGLGHEVVRQLLESPSELRESDEPVIGMCRTEPDFVDPAFEWVPLDQGDWDKTTVAAETVLQRAGRLKGVVHCAGILGPAPDQPLQEVDVRRLSGVNVEGLAHLHGLFLERTKTDETAAVVVLSTSILKPIGRRALYAASHAARQALVLAMRDTLRNHEGTPVHSITPGAMRPSGIGPAVPGKRYIPTSAVAGTVLNLLAMSPATELDVVMNRRKAGSVA